MSDAIIVLNAGPSNLRFAIYAAIDQELSPESRGQIDGLGYAPRFRAADTHEQLLADSALDGMSGAFGYPEAFVHLLHWVGEEYGARLRPIAIGHRIAYGGAEYIRPTLLDNEVLLKLEEIVPLVSLYQPHNLAAVRGVMKIRPDLPQVGCFDTAFHHGRATVAQRFGLPNDLFERGVRRWGSLGLSFESVITQFRAMDPEAAAGRVIVAHLGNSAGLCAIHNGRSVDTTMSLSLLDGLPMGTRCGSLDAGVVLLMLEKNTREEIARLLYEQSGLKGISGISGNMRVLLASPTPQAAEAVEFFVYRAVREIGSMTAALGGLDALIFTAGIGENSPVIRQRICDGLRWLGIHLRQEANEQGRGRLSQRGDTPSVWVIPTDEEGVIAAGALAVASSLTATERGLR